MCDDLQGDGWFHFACISERLKYVKFALLGVRVLRLGGTVGGLTLLGRLSNVHRSRSGACGWLSVAVF